MIELLFLAFLRDRIGEGKKMDITAEKKAFLSFLIHDFGTILEGAPSRGLSPTLARAIEHLFKSRTYHELSSAAQRFVAQTTGRSEVTIQIAGALSPEEKNAMRKELVKNYPESFPIFLIEPSLLGGMKIFVDGTLHDSSWLNRLRTVTRAKIE